MDLNVTIPEKYSRQINRGCMKFTHTHVLLTLKIEFLVSFLAGLAVSTLSEGGKQRERGRHMRRKARTQLLTSVSMYNARACFFKCVCVFEGVADECVSGHKTLWNSNMHV